MKKLFGAIDIGASSGRVIAGLFDQGKLSLTEVHRFPNGAKQLGDDLVWDFDQLLAGALTGLRELGARAERLGLDVISIGIDTWAVDYGLVARGELIASPNCYRDPKNNLGVELVHSSVDFAQLYATSGLQFLPFNSIYQLRRQAEQQSEALERAEHILMVPDLLGFFLTGNLATERTNASSTGLLNAQTKQWDSDLAERLGIPINKFAPLRDAGEELGSITRSLGQRLASTKVVLVGSHDTASAVVGVPSVEEDVFYLSSGTWSLLGTELPNPVLTKASMEANFTNELGVDGRTRYLKNLSGLWLLSESQRTWSEAGETISLTDLLEEAVRVANPAIFDVSDPSLVAPGDMPSRIEKLITAAGSPVPANRGELVASIMHSLASSYASNLKLLQKLTGENCSKLHVIGGGSQNRLLNQLTADYCQVEVIAGPAEATAIGNLMVQARAAGLVGDSLEAIRASILASDFGLDSYLPQS
jgi:rhamnulokinase